MSEKQSHNFDLLRIAAFFLKFRLASVFHHLILLICTSNCTRTLKSRQIYLHTFCYCMFVPFWSSSCLCNNRDWNNNQSTAIKPILFILSNDAEQWLIRAFIILVGFHYILYISKVWLKQGSQKVSNMHP